MSLKCLVFDCDGVILDSVPTKTRAFARLAEPFGEEARDRFVMFHRTHGGVSRYRKFAWFFQEVLGREITEEESQEWGRRFSEYSLDEIKRAPLIEGVQGVLDRWKGVLPMCVCSGTPTEELVQVLTLRGLNTYIDLILGSPPAKAEVLAGIVRRLGQDPADVLMVGDASTDRDAAEKVGTLFYGCGPELRNDGLFPWGETLVGLNDWIAANV
ncbi:MAG: HAD hydrolase-like protein [Desulfovibrionaceae bacterium]|nr:HAD hydrolase-like protein [Desulfovibrionaceae bacterium]